MAISISVTDALVTGISPTSTQAAVSYVLRATLGGVLQPVRTGTSTQTVIVAMPGGADMPTASNIATAISDALTAAFSSTVTTVTIGDQTVTL